MKSSPCALRFAVRFASDHVNSVNRLYIQFVLASMKAPQTVEKFARSLVKNAPLTLQRYKHMTVKGWELPVATALRLDVGPNPYLSADRAEGVKAFIEKREPRWQAK